ncbi:MAG: tol-pal system protein YbgF [Pseudomonadota bacterium]
MHIKKYFIVLTVICAACSSSPSTKTKAGPAAGTDEVADLRARIDDLNNRVYVLTEQLESMRAKNRDTLPLKTEAAMLPASERTDDGMKKMYMDAYSLYKNKEYAKALIAFSSFIEKYPDSVLTDNATFWTGECYYAQKEYALSIDEFTKVLKKFPKESKTPEAMLKIAMAYKELGEKNDSDFYVNELVKKFPNSRAAYTAKNIAESKK